MKKLNSIFVKGDEGEDQRDSKMYRTGMVICGENIPPLVVREITQNDFGVTFVHIGHSEGVIPI